MDAYFYSFFNLENGGKKKNLGIEGDSGLLISPEMALADVIIIFFYVLWKLDSPDL